MIFNPVFGGGGGGGAVLGTKNITSNGTYNASADSLDGYSQVTANVPNTYAAGDEGKVVSNGALVAQASENITQNGTYDTTLKNQVVVNVSGGGATYWDIHQVGAFGGAAMDAAASLAVNIDGFNGKYALIAVNHRGTVTTPSGCTLLATQTYTDSGNNQYTSIYKCYVDSASKSITFVQNSSARIGATAWVLDKDFIITLESSSEFQYCHEDAVITSQALTLFTFSAFYASTDSSATMWGKSDGAWICQTMPLNYAIRCFSGIIMPTSQIKTTKVRVDYKTAAVTSHAQICVYTIAEA